MVDEYIDLIMFVMITKFLVITYRFLVKIFVEIILFLFSLITFTLYICVRIFVAMGESVEG